MEHLGSHWMDFHKILYLSIFRQSVERIQAPFKSDKNKEHFTLRQIYSFDHTSLNVVTIKNVSDKSCIKTLITRFMFNDFLENRAVYGIILKSFVVRGRLQMTIWCMHT
jgi:hypothetical protein